jgi:hypothetical protein
MGWLLFPNFWALAVHWFSMEFFLFFFFAGDVNEACGYIDNLGQWG